MFGKRSIRESGRGVLAEVRGILLLVVALVALVFIFIDIAYLVPLVIIAIGAAIFIFGGKSKVAAALAAGVIVAGLIYMAVITLGGGLTLSTIPGVP